MAHPSPAGKCFRGTAAFTLVEIAIVTVIVGILAKLAVPRARRLAQTTRADVTINNLRVFSGSFQGYMHEKGAWPPTAAVSVLPTGMAGYVKTPNWTASTPIGGGYRWVLDSTQAGTRYRAIIILATSGKNAVTTDKNQLLEIDRKIDDGNLATGNFLLGGSNYPIYVLER